MVMKESSPGTFCPNSPSDRGGGWQQLGRRLLLAPTVFFLLAFSATRAPTQCAGGCPLGSIKPCSGTDVRNNDACGAMFQAAIDCLQALAMSKSSSELEMLADCLQDSFDSGYLRICSGVDGFAVTEPNCIAPNGTRYWCSNNSQNCICFSADLLNSNCFYHTENGFDTKYIIMAALAHEMCHAKGMEAAGTLGGGGGLNWGPWVCNYYCSEVECYCRELDLLDCSPATAGIARHFEGLKESENCQ